MQLLQLWEKNGYFDESIIQQLQSPALGLGQYQVSNQNTSFLYLCKYFEKSFPFRRMLISLPPPLSGSCLQGITKNNVKYKLVISNN